MSAQVYGVGEATTGRITAMEYVSRFMPEVLAFAMDPDRAVGEVEQVAHGEAVRLNIPHSPSGTYPPVVYELVEARI